MNDIVIELDNGAVVGSTAGNSAVFKGIPYAKPPIGELRWRPPVEQDPWPEAIQAKEYSSVAWQLGVDTKLFVAEIINQSGFSAIKRNLFKTLFSRFGQSSESEDCLYLNIRTPNEKKQTGLPVMVWIHGGDHQDGSGNGFPYETDVFCDEGTILVTINYRLGVMGFLCHPELSLESPDGICGNYGMLDQIAALKWVQKNIGAFGGDPKQITIFGESAGGESVAHLLTSPLAKALFQRAIIQSAANGGQMIHQTSAVLHHDSGEQIGKKLVDRLAPGSNQIQALRKLPAAEIMDQVRGEENFARRSFFPVIDGLILPMSPFQAFREGKEHDVPLLVGSNSDEASLFWPHLQSPLIEYRERAPSVDRMKEFIEFEFHGDASLINDVYEEITECDPVAQQELLGDSLFGAPAFYYASLHSRKNASTFLYHFNQVPPSNKQTAGAYHAAEIGYVFGIKSPVFPKSRSGKQLAAVMSQTWAQFAKSGNPNKATLPVWDPFKDEFPRWMIYGEYLGQGTIDKEPQYRALNRRLERQLDELSASN
jgi:para-nitrobenzyl esterase